MNTTTEQDALIEKSRARAKERGLTPGKVVRLKSGGPAMTIERIGVKNGTTDVCAWVTWFDRTERTGAAFVCDALQLAAEWKSDGE